MCASRMCSAASAGDGLPLRAATSGSSRRGRLSERAAPARRRRTAAASVCSSPGRPASASFSAMTASDASWAWMANAPARRSCSKRCSSSGVRLRLVEQQARQLARARPSARRAGRAGRPGASWSGSAASAASMAAAASGARFNPLGERDELARGLDLRVAVHDAHVVLGGARTRSPRRPRPRPAPRPDARSRRPARRAPPARRAAGAPFARSPAPRASSARRRVASLKSAGGVAGGGVAAPRFELRLQRRRRPPPPTAPSPLRSTATAPRWSPRAASSFARSSCSGRRWSWARRPSLQRGAHLGDGGAQLAVRDQRARELLDDLGCRAARACGRAAAARARRSRRPGGPAAATRPRRSRAAASPASLAACGLGRLQVRQRGPVLLPR